MSVTITTVESRRDLQRFINLPAKIHKNHSNWVPPIYMDDRQFFNSKKNKAFSHSDTVLLLAWKNNILSGRIMGIINHKYNDQCNLKEGRFCFIETFNDPEVSTALIKAIEDWARSKKMDNLVGPLGFSDKDPQGLLIEGFDEPVVIATNCNFPYMINLVENCGFEKKTDLVVYKLNIPDSVPEFYQRIHERASKNNHDLRLVSFSTRRQMKVYVKPVLELVNETFKDIYAFAPLDEKEMNEFANRYIMILDPRFLKVVENDYKEVVAFVLGMADISEGIRKCKGRLIPFGIFKVLRSQKKTHQLNLLLGAIREDYRNAGLDTLMGVKMLEEAKKAGIQFIDSHLELESNTKMRAEMEKMGGVVYKRFRIYTKPL